MFKLVIQDDEGKTTVVPLIRDEITIGRKEGNTIRLTERNVSRRHARILRNNGEVHIEDLGSYNGIRVNNARIAERVSLRVSDQVQIGDYKLYLKAEGIEQVDDARTMPIERVDTAGNAPTDIIAAVAAPATASTTTPGPAQGAATSTASGTPVPPSPTQLVGNPARTMVAIAGDDASGRPVATAAVVAALTTPVGHGKLVVLSSNFAGKEFELTRQPMIIGRTDENDIVINHRSISRNHAKIVREPDSGRYTISDLQSSNGVRVNGQDYGKVELRRGDVVDLGHVRLRFIEPGEDFVFARDAVITDVPESGSKRGMLVAIILGVLVLGAAVAFIMTRGPSGPDTPVAVIDAGSQTRVVVPEPDARIGNDVTTGDAAVAMVATIDAAATANPPPTDVGAIALECKAYGGSKALWDKEISCATDKLKALDPDQAKRLVDEATAERTAMGEADKLQGALKTHNLLQARSILDQIGTSSQYTKGAQDAYDKAKTIAIESAHNDVTKMAGQHQCADLKKYLDILEKKQGPDVTGGLRNTPCTAAVAVVDPPVDHTIAHPPGPGSAAIGVGPGSAIAPPPPVACDPEEHKRLAEAAGTKGSHAQALAEYEAALKCKQDVRVVSLAYMEACGAGKVDKAKQYFARMPATGSYSQQTLLQMCMRVGIEPRANPPK